MQQSSPGRQSAPGQQSSPSNPVVIESSFEASSVADGNEPHDSRLVLELSSAKSTVLHALRLFAETVFIPTTLLLVLLHTSGLVIALCAALGWCYLTLAVRWVSGRRAPGTMLLCVSMMSGRAAIALATSSAFIYLLQPVLGSLCMALLFVGSAVIGRPVTMRLAQDFIAIPAHILSRRRVRRMFTQVALLWGASRVADAGMSLGFLHLGVDAGLISRSLCSPLLTLSTIGVCTWWGMRALRRDGIRLRLGPVSAV